MEETDGIVAELRKLLGGPVVLIGWPKGSKGTIRRWKHLQPKDMTPEYLSKLPHGNIGVALGAQSGGLCAVDIDADDLVSPFLGANPQLNSTLQTRGARGRVFWFRITGTYPGTSKLTDPSGEAVGEFRSTGSQSIIWGTHPETRQPYKFVTSSPVVHLDFESLRWPSEIANAPSLGRCTEETEETEVTEKQKSCVDGHAAFRSSVDSVEDALRVSLPHRERENNRCLFTLARALKTLEAKGEKFEPERLKTVFEEWYRRSRKFLRAGQTKEDYLMEFMNAKTRTKYALGGITVPAAWSRATTQPLPPEANEFENEKLRSLVAFLKQLQEDVGDVPFFITSRACAKLLELDSHTTAAKWLGALVSMGYIIIAEPGDSHRATRYRYIWQKG